MTDSASEVYRVLKDLQEAAYNELGLSPEILSYQWRRFVRNSNTNPLLNLGAIYSVQDMINLESASKAERDEVANFVIQGSKALTDFTKNLKVPTPYEHPGTYMLMLELSEEIQKLNKGARKKLPKVHFGTLPTGKVNAMTIPVTSTDQYLVIFDNQIFLFCNLIAKIVVQSFVPKYWTILAGMLTTKGKAFLTQGDRLRLSSMQEHDLQECINANNQVLTRFQQVLFAYLLKGNLSQAPQYMLAVPQAMIASRLTHCMELFIMGHEYSHVLGGDYRDSPTTTSKVAGTQVNELQYNSEKEWKADIGGLMISHSVTQLGHIGPALVFVAMEILERCLSILISGSENVKTRNALRYEDSHPNPILRLSVIRQFLEEQYHAENDPLFRLTILMERMLEILWEKTSSTVHKWHKQNMKLAPQWQYAQV